MHVQALPVIACARIKRKRGVCIQLEHFWKLLLGLVEICCPEL